MSYSRALQYDSIIQRHRNVVVDLILGHPVPAHGLLASLLEFQESKRCVKCLLHESA